MLFLVTIVFIAQIVITVNIISFVLKIDKKVIALKSDADSGRNKLKWRMNAISEITSDINKVILPKIVSKFFKKKHKTTLLIAKNILQNSLLSYIRLKRRKIIIGIKVGYFFARGLLKT